MAAGLHNLRALAAGQPARTSLVFANHVLGATGSVHSTIVLGDGNVKEIVTRGPSPGDPVPVGRVPLEEVHALAKVLVDQKVEALRPDPPQGDIHAYVNRRVTIDVGGQPDLHVDLPASQLGTSPALKAIASAFEKVRAAAKS